MLDNRIKRLLSILPFLTLPLVYNNCSAVRFSSSSDGGAASQSESSDKVFETDASFSTSTAKPLDMVWIVDNSGSMAPHAANVRANFDSFISALASVSDFRLALISWAGTSDTKLTIPVTGANYLQLDQPVGSINGVSIALEAICDPSMASTCSAKGVASHYPTVDGKLKTFLRADSKKIFVFVTDDNSSVPATQFEAVAAAAFPNEKPAVYAFTGLGKPQSPCQAATGDVYKTLATDSGGAVFNICDADWASTFAKLSDNVTKLINPTLALPPEVASGHILSIQLNGQILTSGQYSIANAQVQFDAALVQAMTSGHVKIVYLP